MSPIAQPSHNGATGTAAHMNAVRRSMVVISQSHNRIALKCFILNVISVLMLCVLLCVVLNVIYVLVLCYTEYFQQDSTTAIQLTRR